MDYANKELLEKALEAIRCGTLIQPFKLSLRKLLKSEGLSDGYFWMAVKRIKESVNIEDILDIETDGIEIDLLIDEKAFCQLRPILSSYTGDRIGAYITEMIWWNRQAEQTNEIIECFRKASKKHLCEYAEKFIVVNSEFYAPLMEEAIKSKSLYKKVNRFFVSRIRKLDNYLCKRLAVFLFKKSMKEVQHGA